jgi:hypothetical protein
MLLPRKKHPQRFPMGLQHHLDLAMKTALRITGDMGYLQILTGA